MKWSNLTHGQEPTRPKVTSNARRFIIEGTRGREDVTKVSEPGKNLLGEAIVDRVAKVVLFGDEIKPGEHSPWAYLGIVSVPLERLSEALSRLQCDRDDIGYQHEISWSDISKPGKNASPKEKEQLATRWLKRAVEEHDVWRFSVLGLDTSKMVMSHFGDRPGEQMTNAYRRFFRANLKLHVSTLHKGIDGVHVMKTYHDEEGNLENDPYFAWHPQKVVGARETVVFKEDVRFVNSCHVKEKSHPKASHFVQLCDLIIGATRYAFEDIGSNLARDRAVAPLTPLLERMTSPNSGNTNSRYQHVGRVNLGFFPSQVLQEHELDDSFARSQSTFYRCRPMVQVERVSGQGKLC